MWAAAVGAARRHADYVAVGGTGGRLRVGDWQLRSPTPEAPFAVDEGLSVRTANDLPTFSARKLAPEDPALIARARFPTANKPAVTEAPKEPPKQQQPTAQQSGAIGAAPWWRGLHTAVEMAARDFAHGAHTRGHAQPHRQRFKGWEVQAEVQLPFTAGLIWDLRAAQQGAGVDWSKAAPLDTTWAQPTALNNDRIDALAAASNFTDKRILYEMRHGVSVDADVRRDAILSPHHKGALQHWEQISQQMENELREKWWDGPYRYAPVWPFRMVPRSVDVQPKPDGSLKYRICVDLGWPKDGRSPNDAIDLTEQPPLIMTKLHDLAVAAAILRTTGLKVYAGGVDLHAAYRQLAKRTADLWLQVLLWFEVADGEVIPAWYVDKRTTFGDAIMVHKFSRVADLIVHITRYLFDLSPRHAEPEEEALREWRQFRQELYPDEPEQWRAYYNQMYLDDHMFVTVAYGRALADFEAITALSEELLGPTAVQREKNVPPSAETITQLGGTLDMATQWLDRSAKFGAKLERRLDEVIEAGEWDFVTARSTTYMLNHLAQFRPGERPMNAPLFAELRRWLRQSGVRGARRRIEPEVAAVLRHWRAVNDMPGGMPFYPCLTFPVRGHPLRVDVETDAAGTVGYGAIMFPPGDDKSLSPVYFVGKWLPWEAEELDINVKELLVTVWVLTIIAELWPSHCAQLYLTEHIDNQVAQAVAKRGSSKRSARLNALQQRRIAELRRTGWRTEQVYINTKENVRADALSRDDFDTFASSVAALGYPPATELRLDDAVRDTSFLRAV